MGSNEMIGHDPLAWIKEEPSTEEAPVEQSPQQQAAVAEEKRVAAPVEEAVEQPPVVEEPAQVEVSAPEPAASPEVPATTPAIEVEQPAAAGNGAFDLGEQLVISNVGKTRAEWMDRIVAGVESPITIEGGEIQSIDTAGLQLVIALIRELNEDGVSWQWGGCSELLQTSASQLGLSQSMSL